MSIWNKIWNKIKYEVAKFSLVWKLMLIPVMVGGLVSYTPISNNIESSYSESFDWLTSWTASINEDADYGKGKFYYRIGRSSYPVDKEGNYRYEIHFISESYYEAKVYDAKGNNNDYLEPEEVHLASTKVEKMTLFVNGYPHINTLTNSVSFFLLFTGDYVAATGDVGVVFYAPKNSSVYIQWTGVKPY